jgi:hypothetical protein
MQSVFPIDPAQPITYAYLVLASLPFLIAPLAAFSVVHGLSWRAAFSYGAGFQWGQFVRAALALLCLAIAAAAASRLLEPQHYRFPPRPAGYLLWVLLAAAVVLVQTLGEEVLFRGYLLRAVGAVLPFRIPVTAAVIAVFIAGHLGNDDIRRDAAVNITYFIIVEIISYALLFRTQNLAAPAGLHWMNNMVALLAPTVPGQPTALALMIYSDPVYAAGGSRLFDLVTHAGGVAGIAVLLVLLFWRRSPFRIEKAPAAAAAGVDPAMGAALAMRGSPPTEPPQARADVKPS